jgi:hypothetical protein
METSGAQLAPGLHGSEKAGGILGFLEHLTKPV